MILDLSEFFSDIYAIDFSVTTPTFRGFRMFQKVDVKNYKSFHSSLYTWEVPEDSNSLFFLFFFI